MKAAPLCSYCSRRVAVVDGRCGACQDRPRKHQFTMPELKRMKQLADAGMPAGSIAIALKVDFGTEREPSTIRTSLRRYFPGWRATSGARNNGRPQNFRKAS